MAYANLFTLPLLLFIMIACGEGDRNSPQAYYPQISTNTAILDRADSKEAQIVDGDTIKLYFHGKLTTIRLIGIDSFESRKNNKAYRQAYENNISVEEVVRRGKRAKEYIKERLSKRTRNYLEYDEELLDRYDRTLAYLWFSDEEMLNMDIICEGYAMPLTIKPNDKYAKAFTQCYENAKALRIGVWQ